ncbi:MAG: hypothetical protein NWF07_15595, partial [Candidatus Bathyarchaeota archaeon]|nr:hypothetical protein [Candidatus Bathyarchaeota archaeon]
MNTVRKSIVLLLHLYLFLLPVIPVQATNPNTESWKREIDNEITSINSDIHLLYDHIQDGNSEEARQLIGSINERLQRLLEEDYLYRQIVKIRQDDPAYTPDHVGQLEIGLDVDYGEVANQMSEAIAKAQEAIQTAKWNIGKQNALTWYITFMTMLKFTYDIEGYFTSDTWLHFQLSWYLSDFNDRYWEYSDANYIQKRWDVRNMNVARQNAIITEQMYIVVEIQNKLNQLAKLETSVYAIHGEIESIQNNIVRVNAHIDAACKVDIPGLSSAAIFDEGEYIEALDANLDNVLGGLITWDDYNGTKHEILAAAEEQYQQTLDKLAEDNQDSLPYTRSYNEFVEYYNTFDLSEYETRRQVVNAFNQKINAWSQSVDDLLSEYNSITFDDYYPVDMNYISVDIPSIDILDNTQRQMTYSITYPYSYSDHWVLDTIQDSDYSWYQPLLSHPAAIQSDAQKIFDLVNAARESEPMYEDDTGIATWLQTGFSTLFSTPEDSRDAAENLMALYDYLAGFDNYAYGKTYEAQQIVNKLNEVRGKQEEVEAYVSSINSAYLPYETVNQQRVTINSNKLPNTFGDSLSLDETEAFCDYIERDLNNFIYQAEDMSFINEETRQYILNLYDFEIEKYEFIIGVNSKASRLVQEMEQYRELLFMFDEFRDVYKGYLSGLDGSESLVTQEYLQEKMTEISNYPGLGDFIDLQREINEMTAEIKPVRDPYSVYGGFRGNFSVLETDRVIVMQLR